MNNNIDMGAYSDTFKYLCVKEQELSEYLTELKKEYIGQIQTYMSYIDKNIKTNDETLTIGIIICKKNNKFVMEYVSNKNIFEREYQLIN